MPRHRNIMRSATGKLPFACIGGLCWAGSLQRGVIFSAIYKTQEQIAACCVAIFGARSPPAHWIEVLEIR